MKIMNKFCLVAAFATTLLFSTSCGGEKAKEGDTATKTEEKATEAAASVVGKWKLSDVAIDLEALPAEMKEKIADPKMKAKLDEGVKQMIAEGMTFEFTADGAAKINTRGKEDAAKYEYKDKVLTITDNKGPKALNVTELSASTMAFVMEEGGLKMNMKFSKQ